MSTNSLKVIARSMGEGTSTRTPWFGRSFLREPVERRHAIDEGIGNLQAFFTASDQSVNTSRLLFIQPKNDLLMLCISF